jgi:hypothetical protein
VNGTSSVLNATMERIFEVEEMLLSFFSFFSFFFFLGECFECEKCHLHLCAKCQVKGHCGDATLVSLPAYRRHLNLHEKLTATEAVAAVWLEEAAYCALYIPETDVCTGDLFKLVRTTEDLQHDIECMVTDEQPLLFVFKKEGKLVLCNWLPGGELFPNGSFLFFFFSFRKCEIEAQNVYL